MSRSGWAIILLVTLLSSFLPKASANVYATNLRINGGTTNVSSPAGGNVTLSYILNEPASGGVVIAIKSGTNTVRTITFTNEAPGTLRGTNSIVWDGTNDAGQPVADGTYTFSVTAASVGYFDWTQISNDASNYVWQSRGIAVDQNASSPYYGRVFVGNSSQGPDPDNVPGDRLGILKYNADGSSADEGVFSTGGYSWGGFFFSPWKLAMGADDRVYVNDFSGQGLILSFDPLISSNSLRYVLRTDNYPTGSSPNFDGPFISGAATNLQLWMADASAGGVGIRRWDINTNGIVPTNNTGVTVVRSGAGSDLNLFPEDVAVDQSNRIYTIQNVTDAGSSAVRLLRFPPYGGTAETVAQWKIGSGDETLAEAYGVAVDTTGTYVAVAIRGWFDPNAGQRQNGSVRVFYASNGAPVITLTPTSSPSHDYWDVAWDAVGNLYTVDNLVSAWRVYSPPGTNQATTTALGSVTFTSAAGPATLSSPSYANGQFTFTLQGSPNATYIIQFSTNLINWTSVATTNTSAQGTRQVTIPAPATPGFFRAIPGSQSSPQPTLGAPSYASGQFTMTLFGEPNVTYQILSSTNLINWSPVATSVSASATRQITVPAPLSRSFYRALVGP